MLPLLASAPVLAQTGDPGANQYSQQVCNLAHQNAQSYSKILQLRDKMVKIHRDNEGRFRLSKRARAAVRIALASARPQFSMTRCVAAALRRRMAATRAPA
jgi:hypothetical protein